MLKARSEPIKMSDKTIVNPIVEMMAFVGMFLPGDTFASHREPGTPPSRANEKSCLEDVVTMLMAQKIRERIM